MLSQYFLCRCRIRGILTSFIITQKLRLVLQYNTDYSSNKNSCHCLNGFSILAFMNCVLVILKGCEIARSVRNGFTDHKISVNLWNSRFTTDNSSNISLF